MEENIKVLGAVCLHYGKEYFDQALKSIIDHVDEVVIYYSERPTHGTKTNMICPDTRSELKGIADKYNCTWFDINGIGAENSHRQKYINYGSNKGYDQILIIDSDEVHVSSEIPDMLLEARKHNVNRVGIAGSQWLTPWKSFNEYVTDGFAPVRVINLKKPEGQVSIAKGFIYHMGYCISDNLMEYKISCHGHRADFEKNKNWFTDKWLNYKKGITKYLHPATESYWIETQDFDKNTMPSYLKDHPYYGLDKIV